MKQIPTSRILLIRFSIHLCFSLLLCFSCSSLLAQSGARSGDSRQGNATGGTDEGYFFMGPREEISSKQIKKDRILKAFISRGVAVSTNPESPWFNAACFAHGSVLLDMDGKILKECVIYECTDAQGDLSWSVLWYPEGEGSSGNFTLIQGTGKWAGIYGNGLTEENVMERADAHIMASYSIHWNIDPVNAPFSDSIEGKENYAYMDKCLSFHGPHVFLESRELSNGISLEFSTQSGVLMSMLGPETVSPRNGATCFDRGNTVKLQGKTQGDVMLLEDTDADGDVVWLYHIWWYNKGPGIYHFVGGTGKWEGIQGVGVTRGMYKGRTDDHFMLKSELYWNLPSQ